MLETNRRSNQE